MLKKDLEEALEYIKIIGYTRRCEEYYVIREDDGYINISFHGLGKSLFNGRQLYIEFHKNFTGGNSSPTGEYTITKIFEDVEEFYVFVNEYHNKLFLKHKLYKLTNKFKNNG